MFVWYACKKTHVLRKMRVIPLFLLSFMLLTIWTEPLIVHAHVREGELIDLQTIVDKHPPDEPLMLTANTIYRGPITIDRPMQIVAEQGTTLQSNGEASAITIRSNGVSLQGLTIIDEQSNLRIPTIAVEGESSKLLDLTIRTTTSGIQLRKADYSELRRISITPLHIESRMNSTSYSERGNGIDVRDSSGVSIQHKNSVCSISIGHAQ